MNFIENAKQNPKWHFAFSICATWAGAGSLIVGPQMVKDYGVVPFILWALGNILSCVVFGLLAKKLPTLRKVFTSKVMRIVVGLMCIFQLWVNMSGINDSLKIINPTFATIVTYLISVTFLVLYLKFGMIRNVLTDDYGWRLVYIGVFILTTVSFFINGTESVSMGLNAEGISLGIQRFFTLLVGPFFYPYFWELFDYNDKDKKDTKTVDMTKCFILGGVLFAIYMLFVFLIGFTTFTPALEILKGVLLSLIALSSLTSFIYSIYISFGNKLGFVINTAGFVGWYFLIPMGVMGIWSAMQDIRFILVVGTVLVTFIYTIIKNRKNKKGNN